MKPFRTFARTLLTVVAVVSASAALAQPGRSVEVIVERAEYRLIADSLEALGTLRANETVQITANVSDTISKIHFEDGQRVEAGQVLVELTDTEEAALLQEAQALADEARRQAERLRKLVSDGTAAESLLDEQTRVAATAAARLEAVRSRLEDRIIVAPFAGTVGLRNVSPGARIAPGDVITTLVDDAQMKLDFTVPSLYLPSVGRGTQIEARTPVYPGRVFIGEVVSIDSTINPVTRSITVRAVLPNQDRQLLPGMLMTVILSRAERDALVISEAAIIPQGSVTYVMKVDASVTPTTAQRVAVTLGARQPGRVEVVSGLAADDLVITHGLQKVRPGAPVAIRAIDDGSIPIAELIKPQADAAPGE